MLLYIGVSDLEQFLDMQFIWRWNTKLKFKMKLIFTLLNCWTHYCHKCYVELQQMLLHVKLLKMLRWTATDAMLCHLKCLHGIDIYTSTTVHKFLYYIERNRILNKTYKLILTTSYLHIWYPVLILMDRKICLRHWKTIAFHIPIKIK